MGGYIRRICFNVVEEKMYIVEPICEYGCICW